MQSPNPMGASHGHGPPFGQPPTPDSLVNKAALAGLVFSTDPKMFRTYTRQFKSAIGPQYKALLERAIATDELAPTEAPVIAMHTAIYDMLVLTFKNEDDILDEMISQCGTLGPACLAYLEAKYNSTSLAAAIKNLGAVVREQIVGPDGTRSPGSRRPTSASSASRCLRTYWWRSFYSRCPTSTRP
jgi:hypothetical protein